MTATPVLSAQARPFLSPHLVKKQLKAPLLDRMTRFLLALCALNWMFWKKQFKIPMLTVHHTQLLCFPTPCTLLSILAEPNIVQTYPSLDPSTKGVESISSRNGRREGKKMGQIKYHLLSSWDICCWQVSSLPASSCFILVHLSSAACLAFSACCNLQSKEHVHLLLIHILLTHTLSCCSFRFIIQIFIEILNWKC